MNTGLLNCTIAVLLALGLAVGATVVKDHQATARDNGRVSLALVALPKH